MVVFIEHGRDRSVLHVAVEKAATRRFARCDLSQVDKDRVGVRVICHAHGRMMLDPRHGPPYRSGVIAAHWRMRSMPTLRRTTPGRCAEGLTLLTRLYRTLPPTLSPLDQLDDERTLLLRVAEQTRIVLRQAQLEIAVGARLIRMRAQVVAEEQ